MTVMFSQEYKNLPYPPSEILGRFEFSLNRLKRSQERMRLDRQDSIGVLGKMILFLEKLRTYAASTAHSASKEDLMGYASYYLDELWAIRDTSPDVQKLLEIAADNGLILPDANSEQYGGGDIIYLEHTWDENSVTESQQGTHYCPDPIDPNS